MGGVPREYAPHLPPVPGCALSSMQNLARLTGRWHCHPLPRAFRSHASTAFKLHSGHEWSNKLRPSAIEAEYGTSNMSLLCRGQARTR